MATKNGLGLKLLWLDILQKFPDFQLNHLRAVFLSTLNQISMNDILKTLN